MRAAGNSRCRSFLIGSLSSAVEPVGALVVLLLSSLILPVLPYMLAFSAGAMFYVVVEELIPEASSSQHTNVSTIGIQPRDHSGSDSQVNHVTKLSSKSRHIVSRG